MNKGKYHFVFVCKILSRWELVGQIDECDIFLKKFYDFIQKNINFWFCRYYILPENLPLESLLVDDGAKKKKDAKGRGRGGPAGVRGRGGPRGRGRGRGRGGPRGRGRAR